MERKALGLAISVLLTASSSVFAQTQAQPPAPRQPVTVTQILQRPEVRVIRVAIQPNSTRTAHAHADAQFHLFMPIDGTIDLTIEGEPSERLGPWQAHFFTGGTRHAFTNTSGSVVQWLEVFVQKTATSAGANVGDALAVAIASLSRPQVLP